MAVVVFVVGCRVSFRPAFSGDFGSPRQPVDPVVAGSTRRAR